MAMQMGALREALLNPGDTEKATAAAEEMADQQREFFKIRVELRESIVGLELRTAEVLAAVNERFARVDGKLALQGWMLTSIFALLLAVTLKLFLH